MRIRMMAGITLIYTKRQLALMISKMTRTTLIYAKKQLAALALIILIKTGLEIVRQEKKDFQMRLFVTSPYRLLVLI